jgi:hypothetical protein
MWPLQRAHASHYPGRGCDVGVLVVLGMLAGCATAPTEQIQHFRSAFDAVNTVGQPLLDDLAIAERQQGQSNAAAPDAACPHSQIRSGNSSVMLGFCNQDAPYFSDIGDPPATQEFRSGLVVLKSYVDLLLSLTDGKSASDAVAQVNVLGQKVGALLATFGAGAAGAAIPSALTALQPILSEAAQQLSVQEVRRVILKGEPQVTALIDALANSAPQVFRTVTRPVQLNLEKKSPATFAADKAKYDAYRKIVSDYVVLLGKLREACIQAVAATKAPSAPSLADVANSVGQLQADAAAILRTYAMLRTGIMPTTP